MNVRSATTLFGLLSLGAFGAAFAQTTPTPDTANITNQASATFTNAAGQTGITVLSNTVTTDVLPIYRFAITPNGTDAANATGQRQTGPAGGSVVFTYLLENQGNTAAGNTVNLAVLDSTTDDNNFGTKTVYQDNPNGGTPGVLDATDIPVTGSVTVPYGGVLTLFVEAAVPANATDGQSIRLNLEGRSAQGGQTDLNNWAELSAFTNANLTLDKTATGNAIPGGTVTYTVSGTNNGGTNPYAVDDVANISNAGVTALRDGILVADVLPAGVTYVPGSLVLSGTNTSNPLPAVLYSTNGGAVWLRTQPASGVNAVALYVAGTAGQRITTTGSAAFAYGFTFQATVTVPTAAGTSISNTATLRYDSDGDGDSADTSPSEVITDSATTTVDPSGSFAVGPDTFPNAGATGTYTVAGEGYTITRSGDTQTIASAPNERQVSFRQSLENATNFNDTYTLSSTLAGLPAGSVSFYAANADGSRGALITAPLAVTAGGTKEFYTVVTLPADFTSTTPLNFTVTATSTANGNTNTTVDTISAVTEAQAVNIGNYNGTATPNDASQNFTVNPNSTVLIPLIVRNNGADTDTFDLALTSNFPAGITTTVFDDNCDGVINGTDAPVSSTRALAPGTYECLIVRVSAPLTASPATYDVTVTATSRNDPAIRDSITDTVTVGLVQNLAFAPNGNQVTNATVPVVYAHTLTNNSNQVAVVDLSVTEPGTTGWTYEYSLDNTTFSTTLPEDISVAANGGTQAVYVRVTPVGATQGYVDTITLTATPTYGTTVGVTRSVTDTTTINQDVYGRLNLTKTVDKAQAEPGDTLTYTITGTNVGGGAITNVKIQDYVPANTSFVSISATSSFGGTVLYSTNGTTWSPSAPAPASITNGTTTANGSNLYVGVSTNGDNNITVVDSIPGTGTPPAGVVTITLVVTVN